MKQETLEQAAESYNDDFQIKGGSKAPYIKNQHIMNHFIAGAKWQQERMYSEVFEWLSSKDYLSDKMEFIQKEFEQFKKKLI
jgi:hypothetical protein